MSQLHRLAAAAALVAAGAAPGVAPAGAATILDRATASYTTADGRVHRDARLERRGDVLRVSAPAGQADVRTVSVRVPVGRGERYLGFGERSDAVTRTRGTVENWVGEGPYASPQEYDAVSITVPPWALRRSDDATYFPMPWLMTTAGDGVLVTGSERSRFRLHRASFVVEVDARAATLRGFDGRSPAGALRRMTAAVGRQPAPPAPWVFGPWFQTGHQDEQPREGEFVDALRRADAPFSAVETHLRYLPCEASLGREAQQRARTAALHAAGAAALTYLNNELCADAPLFAQGAPLGAFQRRPDGDPYVFTAFVGGRGATPIVQFDLSGEAGVALWQSVLDRTAADGYDGFMEDYGEYTPPDSVSANGMTGLRMHNLYPVLYHRAGQSWAVRQPRPQVRFVRSGWTGSARYSPVVWGGDPTTGWGFDGLRSAVRTGLSMGLSGVSTWGSDVGGFFTLGDQRLTPELLARWIQLGAVSGVMRTKAEGIGTQPLDQRPQIWEQPTLPLWRRYAKLRTQLYPYLVAADAEYRRTGLPIMRAIALVDRRGAAIDDQFLFGDDLLAAPVLEPGARSRRVWLPRGRWIDLWRSVDYVPRSGGLRIARPARVTAGRRRVTMRAPLDELPLQVRAGAVLPLLPPDVDTLAGYGSRPGLVKLADRRDDLVLLGFPRGRSAGRFDADGRWRSRERAGSWRLSLRAARTRDVRLQASLGALRDPFVPCSVRVDGDRLARSAWSYDRGARVLTARFAARRATVGVSACSS
ncbi:MAG TPA: TIM-barrel domain-containing protein [Capillimicrobium sp.]|nr:TIM-barrel domain-containing protein [Capillimicrobium sp.]